MAQETVHYLLSSISCWSSLAKAYLFKQLVDTLYMYMYMDGEADI